MPSIQSWLPLTGVTGTAALMASASVAMTAGRRRVRYRRPIRADRTGRDSIAQADGPNALLSCMSGRVRRPNRRQIGLGCTQPLGEISNGAAEQIGGS